MTHSSTNKIDLEIKRHCFIAQISNDKRSVAIKNIRMKHFNPHFESIFPSFNEDYYFFLVHPYQKVIQID